MTGTCDASLDQSIVEFLGSDLTSLNENSDNYQNSLTGPTKKNTRNTCLSYILLLITFGLSITPNWLILLSFLLFDFYPFNINCLYLTFGNSIAVQFIQFHIEHNILLLMKIDELVIWTYISKGKGMRLWMQDGEEKGRESLWKILLGMLRRAPFALSKRKSSQLISSLL